MVPIEIICEIKKYLTTHSVIKLGRCSKELYDISIDKNALILRDYQKQNYYQMKNSLEKYRICLNMSPPGTGKTVICVSLAKYKDLPLYIITRKVTASMWENICKKYNIERYYIFTYIKFVNKVMDINTFVNDGCVIIFDDCNSILSLDIRNKIIPQICRNVNISNKSWCIFLDSSPFTKFTPWYYLKNFNIIKSDKPLLINNGNFCGEFYNLCNYFNISDQDRKTLSNKIITNSSQNNFLMDLFFSQYIKNQLFLSMCIDSKY